MEQLFSHTEERRNNLFAPFPPFPSPIFICWGRGLTLIHTQKSGFHLHSHLLEPVSTCDLDSLFLQTSMILFSFLEGVKGSGGEGNRELSSSVSDTGHFSNSVTLWLHSTQHTHTYTQRHWQRCTYTKVIRRWCVGTWEI